MIKSDDKINKRHVLVNDNKCHLAVRYKQ